MLNRKTLLIILLLSWNGTTLLFGQKLYVNTNGQIYEVTDLNNCQLTPVANPCDPDFSILSMAIYKDTLYYNTSGGALKRFKLGVPGSCETLVNYGLGLNSMTVDKNGILYLAGTALVRYNPYTGDLTNLGPIPFRSGGDLVFYRNKLLLTGNAPGSNPPSSGIYEINIEDPMSSTVYMPVPNSFFGLLSYPVRCGTSRFFGLLSVAGETMLVELDLFNRKQLSNNCKFPLALLDAASTTEIGYDDDVTITGLDISVACYPATTGSVHATAYYPSPGSIRYILDNTFVNTTGTFTNVPVGYHSLRVESPDGGCTNDTLFTLTTVHNVVSGITDIQPDICGNFSNGKIVLSSTSPNHPITYTLLNTGLVQDSGEFSNLTAGDYRFNITDAAGCTKDTSVRLINDAVTSFISHIEVKPDECDLQRGEIKINLNVDESGALSSINGGGFTPLLYHTGLKGGTYRVQVKKDPTCIFDTTIVLLNKTQGCFDIFIPSAFTPNSDGRNDVFQPVLPITVNNVVLRIFNRWGQVIFNSKGHNSYWDGRFNGASQPSGVYIYMLQYTDHTGAAKLNRGTVTLIR